MEINPIPVNGMPARYSGNALYGKIIGGIKVNGIASSPTAIPSTTEGVLGPESQYGPAVDSIINSFGYNKEETVFGAVIGETPDLSWVLEIVPMKLEDWEKLLNTQKLTDGVSYN